MKPKLIDIKDMPNFNPVVKNGLTSVSEGKIYWTNNNKVTCHIHGACLCLNSDRSLWRCPTCNEGAFVIWEPTLQEVYAKLSHEQIQELLKDTFGEVNARYHTLDEIPFNKLLNANQPIVCDKSREPPCHLEPSEERCGKCPAEKVSEVKKL